MKLAIIMLNIEKRNTGLFYNSQAEGMAKAFAKIGHDVFVYHFIPELEEECIEEKKDGITIINKKCKHIGKHALPQFHTLLKEIDCYITCSDNYISFPRFYAWCKKNNILSIPYIGVAKSNNDSKIKRKIVDFFCDNSKLYNKIPLMVKTKELFEEYSKYNKEVYLVPVCLDEDKLKKDYQSFEKYELMQKWEYSKNDKVILFVGRLTKEKRPWEMLVIFRAIYAVDSNARLCLVGDGELKEELKAQIKEYQLGDVVRIIPKVENKKMWELYRIAKCFVNLNQQEIFGMAILEAIYYKCKVLAVDAPGPRQIITNKNQGMICNNIQEIIEEIEKLEQKETREIREKEQLILWSDMVPSMENIIKTHLANKKG